MLSGSSRPPAAAILGCLLFVLLGWSGLLVPTLIRSVEAGFQQDDAGLGLYFLVTGLSYGGGVLGGTAATNRLGRKPVLVAATLLIVIGLVVLATTGVWFVFMLGGIPYSMGQGALDGGGNALILDLFPGARGRSLNLLHLSFSIGALSCPLLVGAVVAAGVAWPVPLLVTALAATPLAVGLAFAAMPAGRPDASASVDRATTESNGARPSILRDVVLLGLGAAIAMYVASEVGVSDWLVRFLHEASLTTATTALTLYWGGLAVGRLLAARLGDRFDHRTFAMVAAVATGVLFLAGVVAPTTALSIVAFALAGVTSGPIFPLIVAVAGERYPERSALVGGAMAAAAVVGGLSYPPIMGVLSTTLGLPVAMAGAGLLVLSSGVVLWAIRNGAGVPDRPAASRRGSLPSGPSP